MAPSDNPELLTHEEARAIAKETARETVRETMKLFGVDLEKTENVNEFRADLVHARRLRRMSEKATMALIWGTIVAVASGAVVLFVEGIKATLAAKFGGGG